MHFIDIAIESITVVSVAFFTVQFIAGLTRRQHRPAVTAPAPIPIAPLPEVARPAACRTASAPAITLPAAPAPAGDDLSSLNIRQLKAIASERKIPRYGTMTKPQLLAALTAPTPRPTAGRGRARQLLAELEANQQRQTAVDAAIFTVAQVAASGLR